MTDSSIVLFDPGNKSLFWQGPRVGTCGEPIDRLHVSFGRVMDVPDIEIGYDGRRNGWSITQDVCDDTTGDWATRELRFIPYDECRID